MKICRVCKEEKEASRENFHYKDKKKGTFRTICIPCWKIYHRNHYLQNKKSYVDKARTLTKKLVESNTAKLLGYLKENPCIDCGETDPVVLEFDHILGDKEFNISSKLRSNTWESVQKEVAKCVVRCANCHRRKTAKQFKHQKYLQASVA